MTLGLFLLLALPILADPEPRAVVRMRDGSQIELTRPEARGHIVEFREAPLAARGARATTSSYQETFARFRRDLGNTRSGDPAANAATRITHEYHRVFHGVSVTLDEAELARVRALPYVKAIHEDEPVEAHADTTRIARIGADRVWSERKTRGAGIVVAVIDSGIDASHPALAGKVIGGFDFVRHDDDPSDENGHGTHVAGIIAGEGDGVDGVAPDVKLLAYRVLDEHGRGSASNIIAALEWAADPNRDNDLSDHVDVANLSLGSRDGSADSPTSIAADRAVQAGVVVCLSAGNTPGGQTIGSPAASRLAITVGASDATDQIPFWSSRGPAFPDLALKPDIAAPGNEIVSAKMGGGTVALSGTSMAAPHVAGAAALLLALHPEWTPAEVKAALIATADAVNEEVMARGAGRLNVYTASGHAIAIEPAALSFGNGQPGGWTRSRTVRVTNRGMQPRTFTATTAAATGATIVVEPSSFTLDPGASREVLLTATVAPDAAAPPLTLSLGGSVTFRTSDGAAQVPWVAIDGAKMQIGYDAPLSQVGMSWLCDDGTHTFARYDGDLRWTTLLPYRRCGLTISALQVEGANAGEVSVLLETNHVTGDLQFQRSPAESVHEIHLAGVDRDGTPIRPTDAYKTPYYGVYSVHLPPDSLHPLDTIVTSSYFPVHVNTIADATLTASQVLFDFPRHRIFSIHHEPVHGGIHSDMTLSTLPSDLKQTRVNVTPQSGEFLLVSGLVTHSKGPSPGSLGGGNVAVQRGWRGDVYVTPETNPDAWAAPALGTAWMFLPDPRSDLRTPAIRWFGDRFVMSNERVPSTAAYSVPPGEPLRIGESPLHATSRVEAHDEGFAIFPWFYGPAGEFVESATQGFAYELRDASGTLIREGTADDRYVSAPGARGAYDATIRSATSGTDLTLSFDSSRADSNPPVLTSLRILGSDGTIVAGVAPGDPATLVFSVADYQIGGGPTDVRTARAWWRGNAGEWQPLSITSSDRRYRGELPTNVIGAVDLRVELEDASGNSATVTIDDAFSVGARRRAMRR
ncbi:MAG: S8 family serine peptidase [Thermoanaerobaculia bacterium]